jgi:hypothetical protein
LERQDKKKRIRFVDIADLDYDPMANMGVVSHCFVILCLFVQPDGLAGCPA